MAMIMPYIPRTPAMTTGIIDLNRRDELITQTETIPTPDLAVPYAEPMLARTRAIEMPMAPMKAAWLGSPSTTVNHKDSSQKTA